MALAVSNPSQINSIDAVLTPETASPSSSINGALKQDAPSSPSNVNGEMKGSTPTSLDHFNGARELSSPIMSSQGSMNGEMNGATSTSSDHVNGAKELSSPTASPTASSPQHNVNDMMNVITPTTPENVNGTKEPFSSLASPEGSGEMYGTTQNPLDHINGAKELSSPTVSLQGSLNGKMNETAPTSPGNVNDLKEFSSPAMTPIASPKHEISSNSSRVLSSDSVDGTIIHSLSTSNLVNSAQVQFNPTTPPGNTDAATKAFLSPPTKSNVSRKRISLNPPKIMYSSKKKTSPTSTSVNSAIKKITPPLSRVSNGRITKAQQPKLTAAQKKMAIWNNSKEILGKEDSPLYEMEDFEIMKILQLAIDKDKEGTLLPQDGSPLLKGLLAQIDDLTTEQLRRAVIDFKEDGRWSRNSSQWRLKAQKASLDRDSGKFDPLLEHHLQENWGVSRGQ